MTILLFALPLIAIWFFLLRPQQKRTRERAQMIAAVQEGDEIITAGGFVALITEIDVDGQTDMLRLELAEGVEVLAHRRVIGEVRTYEGVDNGQYDDLDDTDALDEISHDGPIEGGPIDSGDGGADEGD